MKPAEKIVAWMESQGFVIFRNPGEINIVYVEGVDENLNNIPDLWDYFNDRRIVFDFDHDGQPRILYNVPCTTEPGKRPTFSLAAFKRGGVFRIKFGQYLECWKDGLHKGRKDHPALVQVKGSEILGYRDLNRDGKRTGDIISKGDGINQHGTNPRYQGIFVSDFSEGCLVAWHWADHIRFVRLYRTDVRFIADPEFKFSSTIIPGDEMNRLFNASS